jgi:hypothetical protein
MKASENSLPENYVLQMQLRSFLQKRSYKKYHRGGAKRMLQAAAEELPAKNKPIKSQQMLVGNTMGGRVGREGKN